MATYSAALLNEHAPDELATIARAVDADPAYDNLFVADERLYRNPYAQLAVVARETDSVGIGTGVTNPYTRHPAITAAAIATVDELSGGRAFLGLGAGSPMVLDPLGIPQLAPIGAVREATEAIRRLQDGESVTLEREAFSMHDASLDFAPRRRVPVYVAGRGPQILTLAGHVGDGAIAGAGLASVAGMAYAMEHIRRGAEIAGREPDGIDVVCWAFLSIAHDRGAALDAVAEIVVRIVQAVPLPTLEAIGIPTQDAERVKAAGDAGQLSAGALRQLLSREVAAQFSIVGTPEECRAHVGRLLDAGVSHVAVLPFSNDAGGTLDTLEAFSGEVITEV